MFEDEATKEYMYTPSHPWQDLPPYDVEMCGKYAANRAPYLMIDLSSAAALKKNIETARTKLEEDRFKPESKTLQDKPDLINWQYKTKCRRMRIQWNDAPRASDDDCKTFDHEVDVAMGHNLKELTEAGYNEGVVFNDMGVAYESKCDVTPDTPHGDWHLRWSFAMVKATPQSVHDEPEKRVARLKKTAGPLRARYNNACMALRRATTQNKKQLKDELTEAEKALCVAKDPLMTVLSMFPIAEAIRFKKHWEDVITTKEGWRGIHTLPITTLFNKLWSKNKNELALAQEPKKIP